MHFFHSGAMCLVCVCFPCRLKLLFGPCSYSCRRPLSLWSRNGIISMIESTCRASTADESSYRNGKRAETRAGHHDESRAAAVIRVARSAALIRALWSHQVPNSLSEKTKDISLQRGAWDSLTYFSHQRGDKAACKANSVVDPFAFPISAEKSDATSSSQLDFSPYIQLLLLYILIFFFANKEQRIRIRLRLILSSRSNRRAILILYIYNYNFSSSRFEQKYFL